MSWKQLSLGDDVDGESTRPLKKQKVKGREGWKSLPLDDDCPIPGPDVPSWKSLSLDDADEDVTSSSTPMHSAETVCVDVCVSTLKLIPKDGESTAITGEARERLVTVMKHKCSCSKGTCFSQFTVQEGLELLGQWYALPKEAHAQILSGLFNPDNMTNPDDLESTSNAKRRSWALNSKPVCFAGFCKFLGHSRKTVQNYAHGLTMAMKEVGTLHRQARKHPQRDLCNHFFCELYFTTAEDLPEFEHSAENVAEMISTETADEEVSLPYLKTFVYNSDVSIEERLDMLMGNSNVQIRARHLPPGQPADLWYQFLAFCEGQNRLKRPQGLRKGISDADYMPSWATFFRCWQEFWQNKLLHFRKKSSHKECTICHDARNALHEKGLQPQQRLIVATQWRQHLAKQYADRLLYYTIRYMSRQGLGCLCIIQDAMDKSKLAFPKWASGRMPKSMDGLSRPRLVLTGSIAHGHELGIFLTAEETGYGGANAFIEMLVRTLSSIEQRGPLAPHLCVQSDNTTSFTKNTSSHLLMALLTSRKKFLSTSIHYLVEGHTHEDVDRLFSELLPILRRNMFQDIKDAWILLHL